MINDGYQCPEVHVCTTYTVEVVMSDNATQYICKQFKSFAFKCMISQVHVTSSPRCPQANGESKRTEWSTMKSIICWHFFDKIWSISEWATVPPTLLKLIRIRHSWLTELHYSTMVTRQLNSWWAGHYTLQCLHQRTALNWLIQTRSQFEMHSKQKQCKECNRRYQAKGHSHTVIGQCVWLRNLQRAGTVIAHGEMPHSVTVQTDQREMHRSTCMVIPEPSAADQEPI